MSWFFYLVVFGISITITFLHICSPLRYLITGVGDKEFYRLISKNSKVGFRVGFLGRFIHCPVCVGFWIAFLFQYLVDKNNLTDSVLVAFSAVGVIFVLWVVLKRLNVDSI